MARTTRTADFGDTLNTEPRTEFNLEGDSHTEHSDRRVGADGIAESAVQSHSVVTKTAVSYLKTGVWPQRTVRSLQRQTQPARITNCICTIKQINTACLLMHITLIKRSLTCQECPMKHSAECCCSFSFNTSCLAKHAGVTPAICFWKTPVLTSSCLPAVLELICRHVCLVPASRTKIFVMSFTGNNVMKIFSDDKPCYSLTLRSMLLV
jgi:hypothetical protein